MKMNITTTIIPGILLNVAVFIFTVQSSGQTPDNIRSTRAVTGNIITRTGSHILNKGNLIVKGNWINNGTFTDTTGNFVFSSAGQDMLHYDDGINGNFIGTGGAADFSVAARYVPAQLAVYDGWYLRRIRFFPGVPACAYSVRVWTGTNATNLLLDQSIANPVIGEWNEITLSTPVYIDASVELWFGYRCNTTTGYPAGCDAGPATAGYGDMIYWGGAWISMYNTYSLNYNWNIQGFTDGPFGDQIIGGTSSTAFNNLTVTSTSSTTISTPGQTLREILLADGQLNAAGNLTLLSTPARTALIDGSGQGEVVGNVTLQRYLPSAYGYHYFSSPFTTATVGEFSDEIDLSADFPTFYRYDENRMSSGWVSYTNTANILNPLEGYALNFGTTGTPLTTDATGTVSNGNLQVTLYNHDSTYTKGFNLAGNPYPSPIDWDAVPGWTRSNIDNAIYYFNASDTSQYTGSYSSYVNGVSSDGIASNIIPSMQGFFVHVSDGTYPVTGTLACTNTARTTGLIPVFHKKNSLAEIPMIRLTANFTDAPRTGDPTVIYFHESATEGFDPALDALKLMNTDTLAPSLYGDPALSGKLSINAIPTLSGNSTAIPLGLRILRNGRLSFKADGIETLPSGIIVYLFDTTTGIHTDLEKKPEYLVNLDEGIHENRFWLKFSLDELPDEPGEGDPFFIYNSGGQLYINSYLGPGEKGKLSICNLAGQQLWDMEVAGNEGYVIDPEVPMGIYIAFLYSKQRVHAQKILISQ